MTDTAGDKMAVRPRAEGYPVAPLIEAVLAVQFAGRFSDADAERLAASLREFYPKTTTSSHREINIDAASETVEFESPSKAYRLEAEDDTEILLIRPDTISVSQLAPYKSWDVLFARFRRDFEIAINTLPDLRVVRMGCRSLNRIDVPLEGTIANYEEYLAVHIHLPEEVSSIGEFQFQFILPVTKLNALARVQSGVMPQVADGCASFLLDIDLFRVADIPKDTPGFLDLFNSFQGYKNDLYRAFLTKKALQEFES